MSSIPKIKLTTGRKREKCNLDFDCSTTANFGIVQPTMAREMIPESKFQVKVSSLVRLAPMPAPTFGRMFLTHRHVFVPYIDICPQFDSFLASQPYKIPASLDDVTNKSGAGSYVPTYLPGFNSTFFSRYLLAQYADYTIYVDRHELVDDGESFAEDFAEGIGYDPKAEFIPLLLPEDWSSISIGSLPYLLCLKEAWDDIFNSASGYFYNESGITLSRVKSLMPSATRHDTNYRHTTGFNQLGCCRCGAWYVNCDNTVVASTEAKFDFGAASIDAGSDLVVGGFIQATNTPEYIELDNADYVSRFGSKGQFLIAFKLKAVAKRVRTIMQGLGYQFTPNVTVPETNWLKLFAFYKAWFNLYRPKRDLAFTDTKCYDMIKTSELPNVDFTQLDNYSDLAFSFLDNLGRDCYNYLPQDYFGMSITTPNRNYQGASDSISTYSGDTILVNNEYDSVDIDSTVAPKLVSTNNANTVANYPLNIQIALKVLKYVNKNTIVGRSIHDYIKSHFGVSLDSSHDLESVYEIGSVSIPIEVNDVMSTANTESSDGGSFVGEYAGRGIGYNKDDNSFEFENRKNFGVWLTLTSIMPRSGYYQGILRENHNLTKFDFYTPEFDALGYDILLRSEISADYPVSTNHFNASSSLYLENGFGFVPRYSYYKVGRNIVNGDLSLRSLKNDMSCYTLDRMFPYDSDSIRINEDSISWQRIGSPYFIPTVVYDEFRRIDPTDNLGQYNRIFYSAVNREDHFIIHNVFDVKAWLPAKSLTESFDTMSDDDTNVTEIQHS